MGLPARLRLPAHPSQPAPPARPEPSRVPSGAGRPARPRVLVTLALPFLVYAVPVLAGFGWSAIGPPAPVVPPIPALEGYAGRRPELPIAMEYYGAGVVVVPFRAHVRAFLREGDLPLWNPYAGIGQPLAAQGEGGPYSPLALARALAPPAWADVVTLGLFALSALALWRFLLRLGLPDGAAAFGGAAWALSGALTLHIPRDNLADQLALIPPLFLAAAWAVQTRRLVAHLLLALTAGLFAVAGYLPVGVNALLLLVGFLTLESLLGAATWAARAAVLGRALAALGLGLLLASPYLLPIAEALGAGHTKNFPQLALIPMPWANVVAFFFPLLFGQPLHGWIEGGYPDVADWNNLFGYGSTGLLLLALVALTALGRQPRRKRAYLLFIAGGVAFFLARYLSVPPVSLLGYLPLLSQQSPKHTNGVTVFCLVVAASFGVAWLRQASLRAIVWLALGALAVAAGAVLALIWQQGGLDAVDLPAGALYGTATLCIGAVVLAGLRQARAAPTDAAAALVATGVVIGELAVYLPLGNGEPLVLLTRLAVCALLALAAVLLVRGAPRAAGASGLAALVLYAGVVVLPAAGLPERVDVEAVPPHLRWLRDQAGPDDRVLGIQPEYAALARVQDVEAVGPLATREYLTLVELVSNPAVYETVYYGSTFSLVHPHAEAPLYDLGADYPRARPLWDWLGVRYLVLEHRIFGEGASDVLGSLLDRLPDLRVAYRDEAVTIVESPTAERKAAFAVAARPVASAEAAAAILRADPAAVDGAVLVEVSPEELAPIPPSAAGPAQLPVPLAGYRPNELRATFDAPAAGVFVVKDSAFPGWQATLDSRPAPVVRVNGMVRGVIVPTAGRHEVVLRYRPLAFQAGLLLGAAAAAVLVGLAVAGGWGWRRRRRAAPGRSAPRRSALAGQVHPVTSAHPEREQPDPDELAVH